MADSHDSVTQEIWKSIVGYEGLYEVSNQGRVKSVSRYVRHYRGGQLLTKERMILGVPNKRTGHLRVKLCRDGTVERDWIHRLVLTAFVGPCPEGLEACHGDGNPSNNGVGNLRWDTHKHNGEDMTRHGSSSLHGARHWKAKLTVEQVREIRSLRMQGIGTKAIAKQYGVCINSIKGIVNRTIWRSVA